MARLQLTLYVVGGSPISRRAIKNLKALCSHQITDVEFDYSVVDLTKNPELAEKEQIIATPLLIKRSPTPEKRIIGDLSNQEKLFAILELDKEDEAQP